MNSGRREPRIAIEGWARLDPVSAGAEPEVAPLENISRTGARLRAAGHWEPTESLNLTWLGHAGPLPAQVIYHEATGDGHHALGVRFDEPIPESAGMFSAPRRG